MGAEESRKRQLERTWEVLDDFRKLAQDFPKSCPRDLTISVFRDDAKRLARRIERRLEYREDISHARYKALRAVIDYVIRGGDVKSEKFAVLRSEANSAMDGIMREGKYVPPENTCAFVNWDPLADPKE